MTYPSKLLLALILTLFFSMTIKCFGVYLKLQGRSKDEIDISSMLVTNAVAESSENSNNKPKESSNANSAEATKHAQPENAKTTEETKQEASNEVITNTCIKIVEPQGSSFTQEELKLLNSLKSRKSELDLREQNLLLKQQLVEAAQKKLQEKIDEMLALQVKITEQIKEYEKKGDVEIQNLVKVYENMAPKDAAKVFEQLDMNILMQLVKNMKDSKLAPILAKMTPDKAKEVSTEYIQKQKSILLP